MQQNRSWEADGYSDSRAVPWVLWNTVAVLCVHKIPPLLPILSQINSVHAVQFCLYKIHFNIILSTRRSSTWSLSLRFSHQNLGSTSLCTVSTTYPSHRILLHLITRILFGEECNPSYCQCYWINANAPLTNNCIVQLLMRSFHKQKLKACYIFHM